MLIAVLGMLTPGLPSRNAQCMTRPAAGGYAAECPRHAASRQHQGAPPAAARPSRIARRGGRRFPQRRWKKERPQGRRAAEAEHANARASIEGPRASRVAAHRQTEPKTGERSFSRIRLSGRSRAPEQRPANASSGLAEGRLTPRRRPPPASRWLRDSWR